MAKISYSDHVKKNDISVILSEIVFQYLKKQYKTIELSKVVNTSSGGTPSRTNPQYYGGKIPWLKSGELNDSIITSAEEFITEEGLNNSSAKIFPKGTLLVAMYGATAGKTGILDIDAASNQAVCSITPKDSNINTDFLFWFFRAHRFYFIDISRGGAQPNISQNVINKTLFPIVPKDIQEKIAIFLSNAEKTKFIDYSLIPNELHHDIKSAFNYLFCLERLVIENKDQQTYLTKLRQAILQEAIEGKLTENWRIKNPVCLGDPNTDATALLETIKAEKQKLIAEGKIKKEKPLAPINPNDMPFALPDGWVWCKLGEISNLITDGTHHTPQYIENGIPFLSVKNVAHGIIDFSNTRFISREEHCSLIKRCNPEFGDLLLTKVGTTGIAKVIDIKTEFSIFVSVALIKINQNLLFNYYLELLINSPFVKAQSKAGTKGMGNQNLVINTIKDFVIPLPPLAEQQAIVERVDSLLNHINALEQQTTERKHHAEQLMQTVLKEAFTA